jgi:hypothetical protein
MREAAVALGMVGLQDVMLLLDINRVMMVQIHLPVSVQRLVLIHIRLIRALLATRAEAQRRIRYAQ